MQDRKIFLTAFIVVGFIVKVVAEFIHEVFGHGLFVLLFGGEITSFNISLLWPYELSYIEWPPSRFTSAQMAWIYAGGMLACLSVSFLGQVLLLMKKKVRWYFAITLFWLAFWTLVNSTGYLIIGGLRPFGDVYTLIRLGVLTSHLSLVIGLIIFLIGLVTLSWVLSRILSEFFPPRNASLGVTLFWLIIPALFAVMLANPERGLQVVYLPLTFIPALLSFAIRYLMFLSKQETDANPNDVTEE